MLPLVEERSFQTDTDLTILSVAVDESLECSGGVTEWLDLRR